MYKSLILREREHRCMLLLLHNGFEFVLLFLKFNTIFYQKISLNRFQFWRWTNNSGVSSLILFLDQMYKKIYTSRAREHLARCHCWHRNNFTFTCEPLSHISYYYSYVIVMKKAHCNQLNLVDLYFDFCIYICL